MYYKTMYIIKLKMCPSVGDTYCSFLMQIFVSPSFKRELQQEAYVLFLLVSQSRVILPSNHTLIKYEFCSQISSNIDFVSVSRSLSFKQKTCLLAIVYMSCIVQSVKSDGRHEFRIINCLVCIEELLRAIGGKEVLFSSHIQSCKIMFETSDKNILICK